MRLETSINMREDMYGMLDMIHQKTGLKKRDIILYVLYKFRNKPVCKEIFFVNVKYQDGSRNWNKFRVCLSETDREITYDLRKLYKLSLSLIVFLSLKMYGSTLLEEKEGQNDLHFLEFMYNYTTYTYHFSTYEQEGDKIVAFKWAKGRNKKQT